MQIGGSWTQERSYFREQVRGNETNHMVLKEWNKTKKLGLLSSKLLLNNVDNDTIVTVADSGASGHYLTLRHTTQLPTWPAKFPITVKLPDGTRIQNTNECYLPIPDIPHDSIITRIFPQLQTASLLSLGQLCNAGCDATFNKDTLAVYLRGKKILKGSRNYVTKMWEVNFPPNDTKAPTESCCLPVINNVYRLSTTSRL